MIDYCGQLIAQALAKRGGCLQKDVFAIKGLNHYFSLDGSYRISTYSIRYVTEQ